MTPLVSILIPAYNAERTLALTIRSALAQSWPRKEIIIVDDGSRDGTLAVARQFASRSVSVATQPNRGAATARNHALSLSQGEYIQWLDADDLLSAGKVSRQMDVLRDSSPLTLASSGWGYFRQRPSSARFVPTPLWEDLDPLEWMLRKWEHNCHMQTATWLVSRQLTKEAGPWDTRLLGDDDGEYFSRVIMRAERIRFVPDARVYYRISDASRLSYIGASDRKMDAHFLGMVVQIGYLRSLDDGERVRHACIEYLRTWIPEFHPNRPDIVARAETLARSLGAELEPPTLSWKYDWIRRLFGWVAARHVQIRYNEYKSRLLTVCDRTLFSLLDREIDCSRI